MRHLIKPALCTWVFSAALCSQAFAEGKTTQQDSKAVAEASAPAKNVAIVEIEGTVVKVVPQKKEIYVKDAAGKKHEFYFKPHTKLTSAGAAAEFSALKEGLTVKVSAEKHGKRLDPITVEIR